MPLLVHAVAWWLLGLWGGQLLAESGRAIAPVAGGVFAAALLPVLVGVAQRRGARRIALLLAPAGLLVAYAATRARDACRAQLIARVATGAPVWFAPADDAPNRGMLADAPVASTCASPASVQWAPTRDVSVDAPPSVPPSPSSRAPAVVPLRGHAVRTPRGLRLLDARHDTTAAALRARRPWRDRLRYRAGAAIDRHFGARAPLVRALLIADQDGIAPAVRDRYADAGLVHLLSVSGLHVAIIAGAIATAGSLLRIGAAHVELGALCIVAAYIALLGAPPPALRSGVMLAVMLLAKRWQRPVHRWTALALGASVPTVDPLVVTDLGWQLSVGGMAALLAAGAVRTTLRRAAQREPGVNDAPAPRSTRWRRAIVRALGRQRGVRGWLVAECTTGTVAVLLTAPIIAWTFQRVSVVAPLSNLAAGPLVALLQPMLFLALVLAPWPGAAQTVADASQPLMAALDAVAGIAAAPAWAVWPVAPTLTSALLLGVAAAVLIRASAARHRGPWWVAAAAIGVLAVWAPLLSRGSGTLELHVVDVGQGDAIAVRTPRGRWVVMDAGPSWEGGDAGRRAVVPHIRRLGGAVDLFVLSHPHEDHAGGAAAVVRLLRPRAWWEAAYLSTSPGYRAALAAVAEERVAWRQVDPGDAQTIDGATFTVLAPDRAWTAAQENANETSVVLQVRYGAHRFLLTGDAEAGEEAWLVAQYPAEVLASDVLKVGHHGSHSSSSPEFLDAVRPRLAVVSLGAGNRYGHPAPATLAAFADRGIPVLRTDVEGTLLVRSDGRVLTAETRMERWLVPP